MGRKKVKLAYIENITERKTREKRRIGGLLKKMNDLTILCGVDGFVIIYSRGNNSNPTVWSSTTAVKDLIRKYQSIPEFNRVKRTKTQYTYLKERVGKLQNQLIRCQEKNKEVRASLLLREMDRGKELDNFETSELNDMYCFLEGKKKEFKTKLKYLQGLAAGYGNGGTISFSSAAAHDNLGGQNTVNPAGFTNNVDQAAEVPPEENVAVNAGDDNNGRADQDDLGMLLESFNANINGGIDMDLP